MKTFPALLATAALAAVACLGAACSSSAARSAANTPSPGGADQPCTEEAKVCPDGSAVGRTGPRCAFAPCPGGAAPGTVCTKEAKICPNGATVGRTGPRCEFAPCPSGAGPSEPGGFTEGCQNLCGNGTCEEVVCQAVGCPCSESKATCPQDCK